MIEVLVTLVVLALGLLGFALLQTMNLRYTQGANHRTQATNLAYDLLDQMRANRLSAAQYTGATFAAGSVTPAACSRPVGTVPVAGTGGVIERWQCQVVDALGPQASANVTYNNGAVVVTINWGERFALESAGSTTFVVSTQL
ncbi:type IV pilus assembly protein PilV [Luteimonas cucumeris]|uniref:Type IV pilus assembly protein PilV n=2 Tax=Luteimonas cucumeris TaxID=985012 RepID=A0A562KYF3_9GAMM|nr:type IV pilus assembly protein PilV [Luteimonas cucumeris]